MGVEGFALQELHFPVLWIAINNLPGRCRICRPDAADLCHFCVCFSCARIDLDTAYVLAQSAHSFHGEHITFNKISKPFTFTDSDGDQSWLEMDNGQLLWTMRTSDTSLKIYSRCPEVRFTLSIRCLEVPHSFRKFWTFPKPQDCARLLDVIIKAPSFLFTSPMLSLVRSVYLIAWKDVCQVDGADIINLLLVGLVSQAAFSYILMSC